MFKISTRIRYGLRALMELAEKKESDPLSLEKIAKNQNISLKYLESIFKLLKNNNIIKSIRGPGGGYQLYNSAESINLYMIFSAIEGKVLLSDCIEKKDVCDKTDACKARGLWKDFNKHIIEFLEKRTLKDIIK